MPLTFKELAAASVPTPAADKQTMFLDTDGAWKTKDQTGAVTALEGTDGTDGTDGAGYGGTSTTSLAIGTGSKAFTTQAGLAYLAGSRVRAASAAAPATNWMEGVVASYTGTTLTVTVDVVGGSGTYADWNLTIIGEPGTDGELTANDYGNTGATPAIDADAYSIQRWTMNAATVAYSISTAETVAVVRVLWEQDGTGSRVLDHPADVSFGDLGEPTLPTAPGAVYPIDYTTDDGGTTWLAVAPMRPGPAGADGADGADGVGVPAGGTTGQALIKASATDFDTEWGDVAAAGGATAFIGAVAYNNATQSVANATDTVLTLNAEDFDSDGFHSTSSNTSRMTIPAGLGGKYLIEGLAYFPATGRVFIDILKNGTSTYGRDDHVAATSPQVLHPFAILDLVPGDYVELRLYQQNGSAIDIGHGSARSVQTTLSIVKLDSGKVGAGIGAKAYNSAAQSIANNGAVATFDSEAFDTDGFHSTSSNTSRMTIPAGLGGKYLLIAGGRWAAAASSRRGLWFYKNGAAITGTEVEATTASLHSQVCTAVVDLVAGDYVELFAYQDSGGAVNFGAATAEPSAHFEIMRLDSGSSAYTGPRWGSGTAFPSGPATNDRFTRTDLGLDFYYDGTRWLTTQLFRMELRTIDNDISAAAQVVNATPGDTTLNLWLVRFDISVLIATTNNGSNYWTISLRQLNAANGTEATSAAPTTAAIAAGTTTIISTAIGAAMDTDCRVLDVLTGKTGAPGDIAYLGAALFYRYIGA